jgi:crossover junction endodeoxyribonuclease RusA
MTLPVTFEVPGCPVPKERPRWGKGNTYTPRKTEDYERKVKMCALAAGIRPLAGEVSFTIWIYLPDRRRRDRDNIEKAVQDALNGVAWIDDSQVREWHGRRELDAEKPRVRVTIGPAR